MKLVAGIFNNDPSYLTLSDSCYYSRSYEIPCLEQTWFIGRLLGRPYEKSDRSWCKVVGIYFILLCDISVVTRIIVISITLW